MATPGRLPVPLLAVRATSLGCRALHCTALFRSGQIWWLGCMVDGSHRLVPKPTPSVFGQREMEGVV